MKCLVVQCRHGFGVETVAFRAESLHFNNVDFGQFSSCAVTTFFRLALEEFVLVPVLKRNPVLQGGQGPSGP